MRPIAAALALALVACTKPDDTTRILEQSGYTHVQVTGWRPFSAGTGDSFATGFEVVSPSGARVSGVVTAGFLKGGTIRLD